MSVTLASSNAADGHRLVTVAALMATYMEAVNISLPNAALAHLALGVGGDRRAGFLEVFGFKRH